MGTLLVKNIHTLVTMDDHLSEIYDGGLFIRDGFVEKVGKSSDITEAVDQVLDLREHIVLPGLVNTHHHFYQTLTRVIPAAQDANLFNWLTTLYPIWARMTPEHIRVSTRTALSELALSGCTTASDHLYLFPNGSRLDDEIISASEVGLRLHASRGSMSLGESDGGLPPDSVVEQESYILEESQRLIEKYHDPNPGSFCQVVLAPCSPFSVSEVLLKQSALLAREYGVHLHTHLAETEDEESFCLEKFGYRPVGYMESVDWIGEDVWFAHAVYVNNAEVQKFSHTGCGVAHCPTSNMRLASGIAPIREYLASGVNVGVGVDGSASNDGSNMLGETRQAMLLARVREGISGYSRSIDPTRELMTARQALWLGTRGGAAVLGRKDIGSLEPGKCADFFAINLNHIDYSGALHDPVSAVIFCAPVKVDYNVVGGQFVVKGGELVNHDAKNLVEDHNKLARQLIEP
jgi:cytosine/adenosine deaminase-related metal-dependent hydrolase